MLSFINIPVKVIGLLEANVSPREVAAGVCLGVFLGFTPLNGPMALLLAILFFLFKLNRLSTLLTLPLFKALYLAGGAALADAVGTALLVDLTPLNGFWRVATHLPVVALLDVNNTIVAGGLAISAVLFLPVYFTAAKLTVVARRAYNTKIKKTKAGTAVEGLKAVHSTITKIDKIRSKLK